MNSMLRIAACGWLVLILAGCGSGSPKVFHLTGDVSYDGDPVQQGTIMFVSQDPAIVDDSAPIKDGKYDAQVKGGKKKVVIHAVREEGEIDPAMGAKKQVSYIPPEYSVESMTKLQLEVTANGKHDFHLPKP